MLIYDPINQGERDQYWHLEDKNAVASCMHAHNMMGKQLELVGDFFGMWRVWDGMRALDYFLAHSEVDTTRIGLTGNSSDDAVSTWLWALDERVTMAAPSCFVTTFLHNLENELPADSEQYPPGVIGSGLDMADFIIARAPSPALLLGQRYDFFDRRGLRQAFYNVEKFYDLAGAPAANRDFFIGPQGHAFSRHNQEAIVEFFARHPATDSPPRVSKITTLDSTTLDTTPDGNTVAAGAKPIYEWGCRPAFAHASFPADRALKEITAYLGSACHGAARRHTTGCCVPSATANIHTLAMQLRAKGTCVPFCTNDSRMRRKGTRSKSSERRLFTCPILTRSQNVPQCCSTSYLRTDSTRVA